MALSADWPDRGVFSRSQVTIANSFFTPQTSSAARFISSPWATNAALKSLTHSRKKAHERATFRALERPEWLTNELAVLATARNLPRIASGFAVLCDARC